MKKLFAIIFIVIGVLSIVLGIIAFTKDTSIGAYPAYSRYGADFYTDMQHTTADVARNVASMKQNLYELLSFGFGSILLVTGLALAATGAFFLVGKKEKKTTITNTEQTKSYLPNNEE